MSSERRIALIGVPLDLGQGRRGVDMGPSAIRYAGLADRLRAIGYAVDDRGDVAVPRAEATDAGDPRREVPRGDRRRSPARSPTRSSRRSVRAIWSLVLGGDHSLALGRLRRASRASTARARRSGSTRMPTATRPRRAPPATCTACRSRSRSAGAIARFDVARRPAAAVGRRAAQRDHRRARSRRRRASAPARLGRRRAHDDRDRPARHGAGGAQRDRARRGRAVRARLARSRRRRPAVGARRRHAGAGRHLVPRGAPRGRAA